MVPNNGYEGSNRGSMEGLRARCHVKFPVHMALGPQRSVLHILSGFVSTVMATQPVQAVV